MMAHREDLDASDVTFARPELTTFTRLDELGLAVLGQRLEPDRAVLARRDSLPSDADRQAAMDRLTVDY